MGRNYYSPTIIEDLIPISVADINKLFLLKRLGKRSKVINIFCNNIAFDKREIVASLIATINIEDGDDYMELKFGDDNKPIIQRIPLIANKSNLGKGFVYYFQCRSTGKQCRKLYFDGSYFVSRAALENVHYRYQTESKKQRFNADLNRRIIKSLNYLKKTQMKYYRPFYAGYPTVKQKKVDRAIFFLNSFNHVDYGC